MISHVMGENQACHRFFEVMEFGFWNPTSTLPPPAVTKSHDVTPKAILLLKIINQQTFETPPRNSKKGGNCSHWETTPLLQRFSTFIFKT